MAFGFIKKVFSFGRKEVVEEVSSQTPHPEPVEGPKPEPSEPAEKPQPAQPEIPPEPAPVEPQPAPPEVPAPVTPAPAAPEPSAWVEPPAAEIPPPLRQPTPVEPDPILPEIAPEPTAVAPHPMPEPNLAPLPPPEPVEGRGEEDTPPAAEIAPPLRQHQPIETHPLLDEIAPEPDAAPIPAPTRVTVAKAVERTAAPVAPPAPASPQKSGWFQRLTTGLSRSSKELTDNLAGVFSKGRLTDEILEDLEEVLLRADLGMETAMRITDALSSGRYGRSTTEADVRAVMAQEVEKTLGPVALPLELDLSAKPHVILVVGVNGTGKTTTIGKLAAKLTAGGFSVMLAAGDTFRAAAIEQLKIWGERTNSPVVATKLGADAAGLAYEAFEKARAAGSDVLIIDTAGRLQNKAELMSELEKIVRVLRKHDGEAPHTVLQTVDATTGQNALNQVEIFRNVAGVNGLVMTKLDGTARGGILVAIAAKHGLPVYFIGVGEQVDDLEPFSASDFARAIAGVA